MQSRRIRPSPTGNPWQAVRKLPWAEEALSASTQSRNYWPSFIGQSLFLFVSGGLLSMRATLVVQIRRAARQRPSANQSSSHRCRQRPAVGYPATMQSRRIRPSPTGNPWQAVRKLPWAEEALSASTQSRNYWPSFIRQSLFLFVSGGLLSIQATVVVEIVYQSFDPDQIKREISLRSSWCEQLLGLGPRLVIILYAWP